jgi:hypothetical protein
MTSTGSTESTDMDSSLGQLIPKRPTVLASATWTVHLSWSLMIRNGQR